jgi:hypothetical protein
MAWAFLLSSLSPLNGAFFILGNVVIKNPQSLFLKTSPGGGENKGGNGSSNQLITQAFLPFNLFRISAIIFSCSRQMERRIVSNGHGWDM